MKKKIPKTDERTLQTVTLSSQHPRTVGACYKSPPSSPSPPFERSQPTVPWGTPRLYPSLSVVSSVCLYSHLPHNGNRLPLFTRPLAIDNLSLGDRTNIELASRDGIVDAGKDEDGDEDNDSVVHRVGSDGIDGRANKDNADENGPDASPGIDNLAVLAHVPWSRHEAVAEDLAHDGNDVAPVESNSAFDC